ncbi:MAG: transcription antitermination factor NusB [Gemmatimonadaceae bacterium]
MRQTKREREQRHWLRVRRRARARLVQALYAWDATRRGTGFEAVADRIWDDCALGEEERAFVTPLARHLSDAMPDIDARLAGLTLNWRPERIGAIERAILRLAAAEMLAPATPERETTPPLAVIQEAVYLAERFGSDASARFVNGVLDALGRQLGRL